MNRYTEIMETLNAAFWTACLREDTEKAVFIRELVFKLNSMSTEQITKELENIKEYMYGNPS